MQPEPSDLSAPIRLDLTNACLWQGPQRLPLRPKTFAVLRCLMAHSGQLVSKAALLDAAWPETTVNDVALMICIRELRQALGDDPRAPRFIETVHRRGYRFVGDLPVAAPASYSPPAATRSAIPPVGRQEELRRLRAWLAIARSGVRQMVFVTGEVGLGKTTLVEAFVGEVGNHGSLWIGHGQCVEHYGAGEAYLPVLEALGRLCRGAGGQEVIALLGQQAPTWLGQMPDLLRAADQETLQRRIVGATRDRMLRELAEALELLTARQPLVLVLEDLHWSDPSTLDLLAVLARRREPASLLLIGTYRPPEVRRRAHPLHSVVQELQLHGHGVELPLTLLPEDAVTAYLASRLPGLPQVDRLARLVHQRTEGNPLFMVALVAAWLTQGVLLEQDGTWALPAGIEALQDSVPDSLRQMIDRQLDWLSAEEQRVLEAASVAGAECSAAAVAAGLAQEVEDIDDWCTSLARRGQFLRASGEQTWPDGTVAGCYHFVHALYQQVLYQRVSAAQRVRLHQRIGARLEAGHGAQAGDIAAELAMHFERGRDYPRAVHYLWQAGQRSHARSAYAEAISHLTKGLEVLKALPDTPERTRLELALYTALGGTLQVTKGWAAPEVEHAYARARELCQQVGDTPQLAAVLGGLAGFYQNRGDLQTVREIGEQRLALVQRQQDVTRLIGAHVLLQGVLYNMGEHPLALAHFEQTLALYDPQQHRFQASSHPIVNGLSIAANILLLLGYPEQGLTRLHEGLTLARELAHPFTLVFAHYHAACFQARRRDGQAVQRHAEALVALASEHGFAQRLAHGTILRGCALALCGQGAEGIAHMRQGLAAGRATGARVGEQLYLCLLAEVYRQEGQADEGLYVVAEALAVTAATGNRSAEPELHRLKGELLLLQAASRQWAPTSLSVISLEAEAEGGGTTSPSSLHTEAEACFRHALEIARHQQAKFYELRTALSLSRLWQRQGKRTEARELLAPIYSWFTEGFGTADLQAARALLEELA